MRDKNSMICIFGLSFFLALTYIRTPDPRQYIHANSAFGTHWQTPGMVPAAFSVPLQHEM
jgi:hypothetical protein